MYRRSTTLVLVALAAALAVTPPAAGAQQRKVLRVAFPSEDGSLTPYTFTNGYALMTLVYDTLSWRDAAGVARPWLARSVHRTAGGRQIVVTLHRGVRWQDGRPLTSADVAFTFGYMKTHFNPRFTPQLRELAGVRATGPLTVVFDLRAPALGFEDQPLADVPILPQHLWAKLPRGRLAPAGLPVGSGPYRLTRHVAGHSYRFRADPGYFRGRPAVDRIDVPIVPGQGDGIAGLQEDRYDMAAVPVPPGTALQAPVTVRYTRADAYAGTVLAFDLTRPPFNEPQARRAVAAALDLHEIAGATSGPGSRTPADRGMLHPRSRWAGSAVLHRADPGAARVAFSELGVGTFTVAASVNDPVRLEAARRVVLALRDAGARARLAGLSPAALDRAMGADGTTAPTFDAAVVGSPALASYDPAFLRVAFGPPADAPLNDGGYRSARFGQLADAVDRAASVPARRRAVARELRLLARDLPVLPLFFGGATFAYRPASYDGWVDVRGSGILDKQSFLAGGEAGRAPLVPATDPVDHSGDGQTSLAPFIVALAAILVAGFGWALWRRRRS
ncbi:MAG TPA: ABC transporter substrate-binding protein [Solirubrobacteraceae bacterium]|nr:ABC transporter substrate-binding protein [Solirubrobacteraceae bacterium]